jgi:formylglycine-generating enzyme required for sulfatase activity
MAAPPDDLTFHRYKHTNKAYTDDLGNGVILTLMLIPGGEFMMGAPEGDPQSSDHERPQRLVKMPPFLIGRYPVTQVQWRIVAGYAQEDKDLELNPSRFKGDDLPVEQVNWHDATEFCQRLSAKTSKNYHLPSEAEWEYACRAETTTAYYFGDQLTDEVANYHNKVGRTTPVGQYPMRLRTTITKLAEPHRLGNTRLTAGGCTICTATCGSGAKTTGTATIKVPPPMAAPG